MTPETAEQIDWLANHFHPEHIHDWITPPGHQITTSECPVCQVERGYSDYS